MRLIQENYLVKCNVAFEIYHIITCSNYIQFGFFRLFVTPLYCGVMLEQSLMLNRRRDDKDRDFRQSEKV